MKIHSKICVMIKSITRPTRRLPPFHKILLKTTKPCKNSCIISELKKSYPLNNSNLLLHLTVVLHE